MKMPELFKYEENFKNVNVEIIMLPNFQNIVFQTEGMDEKYFIENGEIFFMDNTLQSYSLELPEQEWFVQKKARDNFTVFITEKTSKINTEYPSDDILLNRMLRVIKNKYFSKNKEELRLYFYDYRSTTLTQVNDLTPNSDEKYSLSRYGVESVSLDRGSNIPDDNCFLIGKIHKTVGTKHGTLHDYVETVYTIRCDISSDEEWGRNSDMSEEVLDLEDNIMYLLKIYINQRLGKYTGKIKKVFEGGDPEETRKLAADIKQEESIKKVFD